MRDKIYKTLAFFLGVLFLLSAIFFSIPEALNGSLSWGSFITSLVFGIYFLFYAFTGYSSVYKYFSRKDNV
jgi:uncharacterized membrane protein